MSPSFWAISPELLAILNHETSSIFQSFMDCPHRNSWNCRWLLDFNKTPENIEPHTLQLCLAFATKSSWKKRSLRSLFIFCPLATRLIETWHRCSSTFSLRKAVGRSCNPGGSTNLMAWSVPPTNWDRVSWSVKIWGVSNLLPFPPSPDSYGPLSPGRIRSTFEMFLWQLLRTHKSPRPIRVWSWDWHPR